MPDKDNRKQLSKPGTIEVQLPNNVLEWFNRTENISYGANKIKLSEDQEKYLLIAWTNKNHHAVAEQLGICNTTALKLYRDYEKNEPEKVKKYKRLGEELLKKGKI